MSTTKPHAPRLKQHFDYRKFAAPPYRILFLKYDYYIQDHFLAEFRRQGHQVHEITYPLEWPAERALRLLLQESVQFKPDAIMAINNTGLDYDGQIITTLSDLTLPVIIWYLDNCRFAGPVFKGGSPPYGIAFTYEKKWIPILKQFGFLHAFYLPLATDLSVSRIKYDEKFRFVRDKVTYVGGTFAEAIDRFHTTEHEQYYREWNPDFNSLKHTSGTIDLDTVFAPFRDRFTSSQLFYNFMAYVVYRETLRYRVGRLSAVADESLAVFGKEDWRPHLPDKVVYYPVDPVLATPNVYRNSAINLGLLTFQHETALNQRLYDVPICNGFLLTDWQEALADHFEPGTEVIYFQNDDDLREKVRYYREHPQIRQNVTRRAQERIFREHLMEHRVASFLTHIKDVFRD